MSMYLTLIDIYHETFYYDIIKIKDSSEIIFNLIRVKNGCHSFCEIQ